MKFRVRLSEVGNSRALLLRIEPLEDVEEDWPEPELDRDYIISLGEEPSQATDTEEEQDGSPEAEA